MGGDEMTDKQPEALQAENERLRAEVDALRQNAASSVQPELAAVALAFYS